MAMFSSLCAKLLTVSGFVDTKEKNVTLQDAISKAKRLAKDQTGVNFDCVWSDGSRIFANHNAVYYPAGFQRFFNCISTYYILVFRFFLRKFLLVIQYYFLLLLKTFLCSKEFLCSKCVQLGKRQFRQFQGLLLKCP